MKNINIYKAEKYESDDCTEVKGNIYKTYDSFMKCDTYVTSLCLLSRKWNWVRGETQAIFRSIH